MTQRLRAQQLRDQIIAALREADESLSTPDIAAKVLPWHHVEYWVRAACRGNCTSINGYPVVECGTAQDPDWGIRHTVKMPMPSSMVYQPLTVLQKAGQVAKVSGEPFDRRVYWCYIGIDRADVEREIRDLDQLFTLEAAGGES